MAVTKIQDRRRFRTTLNEEDKQEFNELIVNELINNGLNAEDVALLSPASMILMGFNTLFDDVTTAIHAIGRESNLIHAEYPSSLFNQLAQHTDEIIIARPSKIHLFVRIPVEDIKRRGRRVQDNTWEIIFDNTNTVIIDELTFMPVKEKFYVRVTFLNNRKTYRVFYEDDLNRKVNVLVQNIRINNEETIGFKAEFKQIVIENKEFNFDDEQLSKFVVKTELPISDFNLYYKANLGAPEVKINKRLYYTRGAGDFMEYQILGNNTIAVIHKYIQGGFKPELGGILRVECMTTTGRDVKYKLPAIRGNTTIATSRVEYEPVGKRVFESSGGNLASTDVDYLRNKVIQFRGARRRIDTESDLQTFLLNYDGDSNFLPRLVHNDIKHRIFNIYSVLSFGTVLNGIKRVFTIPTNTGTVVAPLKDLHQRNVNGFTHYCLNYNTLIQSEQSRKSDMFKINKILKPGKEPVVPVKTDPSNPNNNLYTYYYVAPFIISYDKNNNFARTYMGAQYDEAYLTFQTFEDTSNDVPVRFVNTTIRVNDYLVSNNAKKITNRYQLNAEIRAEGEWTLSHKETFQAYLEILDENKQLITIPAHSVEDTGDGKYDLTFDIKTDKLVFNQHAILSYIDDDEDLTRKEVAVKVNSQVKLKLCIKEESQSKNEYKSVAEFQGEVQFYKDITKDVFLQTEHRANDDIWFISCPLVKSDFYVIAENQKQITQEMKKIVTFLDHAVYETLDEYSSRANDVHDIMETNLRVSIKFAKTYGLSKFLDVGEINKTFIHNLQVRPSVLIRKSDPEFEEIAIASELNQLLIKHDYFMEDLHMSALIYSVLDKAGDAITRIQFINFDDYPDNYHMISRNDQTPDNLDPPEVVSIEPVYDTTAETYKFNMKFTYI